MFNSLDLLTRRRLVQLGAGGYLGLNLEGVWRAEAASSPSVPLPGSLKPLKACILVFYYGGPSHLDTDYLKPESPSEVRDEFQPISTLVPGWHICEHLPKMARQRLHAALVLRCDSTPAATCSQRRSFISFLHREPSVP